MSNSKKPEEATTYPWAKLYNLESRVSGRTEPEPGRPGRRHRTYIRRPMTAYLSDEEMSIVDRTDLRMREALRPATVTKSQIFGLAVRLLDNRMQFVPEHATDWEQIVQALFEGSK